MQITVAVAREFSLLLISFKKLLVDLNPVLHLMYHFCNSNVFVLSEIDQFFVQIAKNLPIKLSIFSRICAYLF